MALKNPVPCSRLPPLGALPSPDQILIAQAPGSTLGPNTWSQATTMPKGNEVPSRTNDTPRGGSDDTKARAS